MRARDNPFRVQRITRLGYRLPEGQSWEGLIERFHRCGRRAALVGPEGRGKSTLLAELGTRLEFEGLRPRAIALGRDQRRLSPEQWETLFALPTPRDLLLVDGADQLSRWSLWRTLRRARPAAGLLVTSHRPLRLPTLVRCTTSTDLFRELIDELLDGQPAELPADWSPEALFERHRGNVREAFWELYASCAALPGTPRAARVGES